MIIERLVLAAQQRQRLIWLALVWGFIVVFSFYIMICFAVSSDFLGINVRSAPAMLSGTAITPHVYRQMVPVMANTVIALTPQPVADAATALLHDWLADRKSLFATGVRFRHPVAPPPELADEHLYPLAVLMVIDYAFLMGYLYFVWVVAKRLFPQMFSAQLIAPLVAALSLPPVCAKFGYIYDFPVLFFSMWLTHVLLQRRLWLFTLSIALVTFNKETSIYLIALFALWGWRELPRRTWQVHLLCQIFLLVLVKAAVTLHYSQNAGEFLWVRGFYDHIVTNMDGYAVYTFLGLVAAAYLISYRWSEKPFVLQCWVALLPFSALSWLIFGMRNEYRVMYEMFGALSLLTAHTMAVTLRWQDAKETTPDVF
jgi:hypothetical protein